MRCNTCGKWLLTTNTNKDYCQSCSKSVLIQKYERALFLACYQLSKHIDDNNLMIDEKYWLDKSQQQQNLRINKEKHND